MTPSSPARNSWARRDFPTPAAPRTVKSWQERSATACASAACRRASSRSLPTIAPPRRREGGSGATDTSRYASTRRRLALQLERLHRLDDDRVADERPRLGADQDLARLRRLLEPRGHVDRVAGREPLLRARHDLAGVDADPQLERRPVVAQEALVEAAEPVAQLGGRAHGPQRVVLVQRPGCRTPPSPHRR